MATMVVGVTAYDVDDANRLLDENLFKAETRPALAGLIEDIDVSTLDPNHILPNIGFTTIRGIWYPNLNSY
jgi:hypothetical protein